MISSDFLTAVVDAVSKSSDISWLGPVLITLISAVSGYLVALRQTAGRKENLLIDQIQEENKNLYEELRDQRIVINQLSMEICNLQDRIFDLKKTLALSGGGDFNVKLEVQE